MKDQEITRYEHIYEVVRQVPEGKVATYGQIARIVGRCTARMVGYAMASLPYGTAVPWQRVINHKGEISLRSRGDGALRQRKRLRAEGVRFDRRGRVNLRKYRWENGDREEEVFGLRAARDRKRLPTQQMSCHCEKRSDEAIPRATPRLPHPSGSQ